MRPDCKRPLLNSFPWDDGQHRPINGQKGTSQAEFLLAVKTRGFRGIMTKAHRSAPTILNNALEHCAAARGGGAAAIPLPIVRWRVHSRPLLAAKGIVVALVPIEARVGRAVLLHARRATSVSDILCPRLLTRRGEIDPVARPRRQGIWLRRWRRGLCRSSLAKKKKSSELPHRQAC